MRGLWFSFLFATFFGLLSAFPQIPPPKLADPGLWTNGAFRFEIDEVTPALYRIESSADLSTWKTRLLLLPPENLSGKSLPVLHPQPASGQQYYRVHLSDATAENDSKNQIYFPEDPFLSPPITWGQPETRWIKFAITTNDPTRVHFQDSTKYPFHFEFAITRLDEFRGMNRAEFDAVSLRTNSQRVVLGTVLFSPEPQQREAAIQFVGLDAYSPEKIAAWFDVVRAAIHPPEGLNVLYIPTYEQAAVAEANRAFFAARGITVASLAAWDTGGNAYSMGWAVGTLKFFPAAQVEQAYASGQLKPADILLTDAVPAELPYVSGILTLSPATPNSHVAILARSYGVPFVYLGDAELRELAQASVGKDIILTAEPGFPGSTIRLLDAAPLSAEMREELRLLKLPAPLAITPKEHFGSYTASTDTLTPADIKFFGGKASNFGFLQRQIPNSSPKAIAISFDLWDEFMNQQIGQSTLRQMIAARLSAYTYPPNVAALKADLQFIRDLIEDETLFTPNQQQAIAAALLGNFDPNKNIRFRSSTNVEDAENFTGAGLYDSYSGCLADEQDADTNGPSLCDATESRERGVFRAIRKVYASFYNDNAFLERLRHGVDETKIGMAILVHHSTPDPQELANGVATLSVQRHPTYRSFEGELVTQKGAVSVTNPDNSALPEVVQVSQFFDTPYVTVEQYSSLVPLGTNVLKWDRDYLQLTEMLERVAAGFEGYYPAKQSYTLDFEYKKVEPGVLSVKQVRQVPTPEQNATVDAYLINDPAQWELFQGEYGTVFGNHRLKGEFVLETRSFKIAASSLNTTIFENVEGSHLHDGAPVVLDGNPKDFPGAVHVVLPRQNEELPVRDSWRHENTSYHLTAYLRERVSASLPPLLTLDQMRLEFASENAVPQMDFDHQGKVIFTSEDYGLLRPRSGTNRSSIFVSRVVETNGITATIEFFWPDPPKGTVAGYTAPLQQWHETRLEGITTEPIVLKGYYSQTYRPEHHNFAENFLFEPRLEPGISPEIIQELEARDIRQIYIFWGGMDAPHRVLFIGADGKTVWAPGQK